MLAAENTNHIYNKNAAQSCPTYMPQIYCFPPIEDSNARVLILGSMPGKESLRLGQYYAHKRNAFWTIMGELTGAAPSTPYETRVQILKSAGIALWDVLASCRRCSSMDSDIDEATPNDFKSFFRSHPHITDVFFNGSMAEKCYQKHVHLETLPLHYQRLPSTSPAHASMAYDQKLKVWQAVMQSTHPAVQQRS